MQFCISLAQKAATINQNFAPPNQLVKGELHSLTASLSKKSHFERSFNFSILLKREISAHFLSLGEVVIEGFNEENLLALSLQMGLSLAH